MIGVPRADGHAGVGRPPAMVGNPETQRACPNWGWARRLPGTFQDDRRVFLSVGIREGVITGKRSFYPAVQSREEDGPRPYRPGGRGLGCQGRRPWAPARGPDRTSEPRLGSPPRALATACLCGWRQNSGKPQLPLVAEKLKLDSRASSRSGVMSSRGHPGISGP